MQRLRYHPSSAMRYGLDASVLNVATDQHTPVTTEILQTLQLVRPYAEQFGNGSLLSELETDC